jgi:hypothetical protein
MRQLISTIRQRLLPARAGNMGKYRAAVERRRQILLVVMAILGAGALASLVAASQATHGRPNNVPPTKRVISIGGEPRSLAVDGNRILVAGAEGRVTELRASLGTPVRKTQLRRPLREIAAFDGQVFVVSDDGCLTAFLRARPRTHRTRRVAGGHAILSVAVGSRGLFLADRSASWIEQRSTRTLRVLSRARLPGRVSDIVATPEGVWAALPERGLVAFVAYARDGHHARPRVIEGYPSPHALAVGQGSIWVASRAPSVLWAIDEQRRALRSEVRPADIPPASSVAVGNGWVWVSSADSDGLVQVGAGSGRLVDRFPIGTGRQPRGLGVDAAAVWTANYGDGTVTRTDLVRLGLAHRLPRPADEPPRLIGVSRSVWVFTAGVLMFLSGACGALRWFEGIVLEWRAGDVPRWVRLLYSDPSELGYLAGRRPVREVVTDENERGLSARLGKRASAVVEQIGRHRTEKVFEAHESADLVRTVIGDLANNGKLHRDYANLPMYDMTPRRRLERLNPDMLVQAMRDRHERMTDAAVLIEGEVWSVEAIDEDQLRMTLAWVRSRDRQQTYPLPPAAQLQMRLNVRHIVEGRGKRQFDPPCSVACDVLAVVERRTALGPLELTPVALYTPVSENRNSAAPRHRRGRRHGLHSRERRNAHRQATERRGATEGR